HPGDRVLQHAAAAAEAGGDASVQGGEPRAGQAGEPQGLRGADAGVLRPPPDGQAGPGLVEGGRAARQDGGAPEGAEARNESPGTAAPRLSRCEPPPEASTAPQRTAAAA